MHAIRKAMLGPGNNLRKSKKSKKEQETKLCCFFAGKTLKLIIISTRTRESKVKERQSCTGRVKNKRKF